MATGEHNIGKSLSESLTPEENDVGLPVPEEKDVGSGCKNVDENNTVNISLNKQSREATSGNVNETVESEGCQERNETTGAGCCNSELIDNHEGGTSETRSKVPNSSGKLSMDEALIEEDENEELTSDEEEHYESAEEHLTPEEAEERKNAAMELKSEGNEHFRKQEYAEGKDLYSRAIKMCPKEFPENKSVFYSNRAACSQKMEDYESAISDCSKALELAPNYLKARLRRAQCYEKVEKLEEALEDYKIVFERDRSCQTAREAIMRLPEEIKVKHEKLKEEMIGKLKDLGNMVLRPFGLSTDNFKLQQDPNTGGYSINFQNS